RPRFTRFRFATEEIQVMLAHKERHARCICLDDRVGAIYRFVIVVRNGGGGLCAESCSAGIAQGATESFVTFGIRIVDDRHGKGLRSLAGGKIQSSDCGREVTSSESIPTLVGAIYDERIGVGGAVVNC